MSKSSIVSDATKPAPSASNGREDRVLRFPRAGDEWEFQLPGRSKKRKIVGYVSHEWHQGAWDSAACRFAQSKHPRVNWRRRNKGRYTSIRVKFLLKYGRRLTTESEREAKFTAREAALGH